MASKKKLLLQERCCPALIVVITERYKKLRASKAHGTTSVEEKDPGIRRRKKACRNEIENYSFSGEDDCCGKGVGEG